MLQIWRKRIRKICDSLCSALQTWEAKFQLTWVRKKKNKKHLWRKEKRSKENKPAKSELWKWDILKSAPWKYRRYEIPKKQWYEICEIQN